MTTPDDPHEEFEIAALLRARRALDSSAMARLDAHLAACAACRSYAATAAATESMLRRRVREAAGVRDWDKIRDAVRARSGRDRNRMLISAAVLAAYLATMCVWPRELDGDEGRGPVGPVSWAIILTIGLLVTIVRSRSRRRRALAAEEKAPVELARFHRREVEKEIDQLRSRRTFALMAIAVFVVVDLLALAQIASGRRFFARTVHVEDPPGSHVYYERPDDRRPDWRPLVHVALLHTALVWWFWYRTFFVLPRLERERRDLAK